MESSDHRKKQGGLGIKNLKNQSKALKLKWLWRYAHEPHSMWSKVIKLKYGEMDSWVTKEATNPYGVTVWRSIRNWWPSLRNHTTITVHNGIRTGFWKDSGLLRQLDICSYTAKSLINCGRFSSISEAFSGQCLARLLTLSQVGRKQELGQITEVIGGPFQHASGGPFGEKGMLEALRIEADPYKLSKQIALEVTIWRDGKEYKQKYSRGKPVTTLICQELPMEMRDRQGTSIQFWPDKEVFTTEIQFDYNTIAGRIRELAFLNPELTIVLKKDDIDPEKIQHAEYFYAGGLVEYVKWLNADKIEKGSNPREDKTLDDFSPLYKPYWIELPGTCAGGRYHKPLHDVLGFRKEADGITIDMALQWCSDAYSDTMLGYANSIRTIDGGTHIDGVKAALTRTLNSLGKKSKTIKEKDINLSGEHVREGLTCVISVKVPNPEFEGQTKTRLGNPEVRKVVDQSVQEYLTEYLELHPDVLDSILSKSLNALKAALAAKRARELVRQKSVLRSSSLPGKLADCSATNPEEAGLRQGDPLSPFLFIIAMDGLSDMLKTARENLWLKGFKISNRVGCELEITHLQYADDTLIFCDANKEQLRMLRVIFILFEAVSGLHINWNKSFLYPVNVVPDLSSLARTLGGRIGDLPTTYLGMPLGANNRPLGIWNGVIEKCERRLVNWKSQYLSLGGRLTLINSVLDSMPSYMMSLFPIPDGVIDRLDALRRNFLWEGNSETKKFHLVKWAALIGNKQVGGLEVRNLKTQNQCLLMKWLWRLASNEQALWKEVIQAKYEMEDHWSTSMVTNTYGTSLWRTIRNLWPKLGGNCKIKIGNGVKVSFWEDSWLEQGPLKTLFPDVFILNQQQRATVAEVWSNQGWNLSFRRPFNDWEIQRVVEFYRTLEQFRGGNTVQDCLEWKDHKQGRFSVKGAYKKFNPFNNQINGWPWKMIWKAKIPYKVSCFTWLLGKQAILTRENLMKRGKG
ncbi:hypothetical protein MTR67_052571 [Solanum verrucosum]|uniref:DNA topoisomerase 2 n=1 Tax=Solanum verrucosum TaxID=315347 RepID=A0AAF0V9I0_SOLVR|nr:hypothetical protein MTR67_052571 [Solanum verrucosum]